MASWELTYTELTELWTLWVDLAEISEEKIHSRENLTWQGWSVCKDGDKIDSPQTPYRQVSK